MANNDIYERMRSRIEKWASTHEGEKHKWVDYILLLPDMLHLLCSLTLDPAVPAKQKAKLAVAIAYIISPADFIPEGLLGPVGLIDDIALAAFSVNQMLNEIDEQIVLKHWKGRGDLLSIVRNLVATADEIVGAGLWRRLKDLFSAK